MAPSLLDLRFALSLVVIPIALVVMGNTLVDQLPELAVGLASRWPEGETGRRATETLVSE
jgi:hypothetical protein